MVCSDETRPSDKERGGGQSQKEFFSALRASVWSKNKGGPGPRAPPLDPSLVCIGLKELIT